MKLAALSRLAWRESRGSRSKLIFFIGSLALGVAAIVTIGALGSALDSGIRREARRMLAADLVVRGRSPIPEAIAAAVDAIPGSRSCEVRELATVVSSVGADQQGVEPPPSMLVELKSVDPGYPFYGSLTLTPALEAGQDLGSWLSADDVVVAPEVLRRLDSKVGDLLMVGGKPFHIRARLENEPDRVEGAFNLGPRILMSSAGLSRADLVRFGSRVSYRLLVALPNQVDAADLRLVSAQLGEHLDEDGRHRLETYLEGRPSLRASLRRSQRFLALAALFSVLLGAIGVAHTVRAWLAERFDNIAIYRCLGIRPFEVLLLYVGQTLALGVISSVVGALIGLGLEIAVLRMVSGQLPVEDLRIWQPGALLSGIGVGSLAALLSAFPSLAATRRVSPLRVLRRDIEPLPPSRLATVSTASVLVLAAVWLAVWQSRSLTYALAFNGVLIVLGGILALSSRLLSRLLATLSERFRFRSWLRQGLGALVRPGTDAHATVTALGLGALAIITMFIVERQLVVRLERDLPAAAPTMFLIDIQSDQWPGVRDHLQRIDASDVRSVPVIMARLTDVDGRPVAEMLGDRSERDRWALRREQRLTYAKELPTDNRILEGELWSLPETAEVSLEIDYSEQLGAGIGSVLGFDIQGAHRSFTVTTLRSVDWSSFGINFFLVVEPGSLENAPQFRIATFRSEQDQEDIIRDRLAEEYPNVTSIRIREIFERLAAMLERLALAARILGTITVLTGLGVLIASVSAGARRRRTEVALLKTLGMSRWQVAASLSTEYSVLGFVAGFLGSAGAAGLSWLILTKVMELSYDFEPLTFAIGTATVVVATALAGMGASFAVLDSKPLEVIRNG